MWVSASFCHWTGFEREEILGRKCNFLQGPETSLESRAAVRRLIANCQEGFVKLVNYTKAGERFENALYMKPLFDKSSSSGADDKKRCRFFLGSQTDVFACLPASRGVPEELLYSPRDTRRHVPQPSSEPSLLSPVRTSTPGSPQQRSDVTSNVQLRTCGKVGFANGAKPLSIENEFVKGGIYVATRDPDGADASTTRDDGETVLWPEHGSLFDGTVEPKRARRCVVILLELEFKKLPDNHEFFLAGEVEGALSGISGARRLLANFLLSLIRVWDRRMSYQFGAAGAASGNKKCRNAFIASALESWVELDVEDWATSGGLSTNRRYRWELGSAFLDLERWRVVNCPQGQSIFLRQFWDDRPLRLVLAMVAVSLIHRGIIVP